MLVELFWPDEFSLKSLDNLRTLWFNKCDLPHFGETKAQFLPEKLENLCFYDCFNPSLPELKHLRKLEIYMTPFKWDNLKIYMEPNTISKLSSLEELSLSSNVYICEEYAKGGSILPILDEVSELPYLTSLHICSREPKSSKLATIFHNLREFHLFVGERRDKLSMKVSSVTKSIELSNHDLIEGYQTLIEKAEEVILCGTNFTGSSTVMRDAEEFISLRYMTIKDCKAIEYLSRMSPHDKIPESLHWSIPFSNLIKLEINNCPNLKYLFSVSVARCLVQLQELHMKDCPLMEQVVLQESTSDGDIIKMSKLRIMILTDLPRLTHFHKGNSFSGQIQPMFDGMVRLLNP